VTGNAAPSFKDRARAHDGVTHVSFFFFYLASRSISGELSSSPTDRPTDRPIWRSMLSATAPHRTAPHRIDRRATLPEMPNLGLCRRRRRRSTEGRRWAVDFRPGSRVSLAAGKPVDAAVVWRENLGSWCEEKVGIFFFLLDRSVVGGSAGHREVSIARLGGGGGGGTIDFRGHANFSAAPMAEVRTAGRPSPA
jgi:hypothetical protein